jgi:hypothetical protein
MIVAVFWLQANYYLVKPVEYDAFESLVGSIGDCRPTRISLPLPRRAV